MSATCPWCQAPRDPGPNCPRCGANYAKAEAIKKQGRADTTAQAPEARNEQAVDQAASARILPEGAMFAEREGVEDPDWEWKACAAAIPVMFLLALAFHAAGIGHFLQRTFLTMPVHELGHAVAAWFCGFAAMPTLWKTLVAESRGFLMPLVLLGVLGYLAYRAQAAENRFFLVLCGALVVLQVIGTLVIKEHTAQMLIVFGGDGLGMVLAVLLMASFFFGKGTQLYKGSLRWGFVAIGAAAYVDMFATWWGARSDFGKIPFGMQEGTGLSDATKLVDDFGWSADEMIRRHVAVGLCSLLALVIIYAWGVWRAWQDAQATPRKV